MHRGEGAGEAALPADRRAGRGVEPAQALLGLVHPAHVAPRVGHEAQREVEIAAAGHYSVSPMSDRYRWKRGRLVASPIEETLWLCVAGALVVVVGGGIWVALTLGDALFRHDWRLALGLAAIGLVLAVIIAVVRLVAALLARAGRQLRGG